MDRHRIRWAYLLALAPVATEWLEAGRFPNTLRDYLTEAVIGIIIGVMVWLLYRTQDRLRDLAEHDELTRCFNRRRFNLDLEREYTRARRQRGTLTLAYLDIDRFKAINDTHGHSEGDAVLRATGELLRRSIRSQVDRCYRIGGDEFALVLVGMSPKSVKEVLSRLTERAPAESAVARHLVTFSFGAAELAEGETLEDLLHRADTLMYERKRKKSGQVDLNSSPS